MTLAPGSALWMMRHELRLYWRTGQQAASFTFFIITQVLLHGIALAIALATLSLQTPRLPRPIVLMGITFGLGFALMIMISRGMTAAIQSLYTRGDLDLLLSSPVRPGSIVAVRAAAIAVGITLEVAMLLWPFANVFVAFGRFAWLKAYVLLPALGMLATSLALLLMIALFRMLGPRRTRVAVQIGSAAIGMAFMLFWVVPNAGRRPAPGEGPATFRRLATTIDGPAWLPAEQVVNGFAPTLLFAAACALVLVLTVRSVSARFVEASTLVVGLTRGATVRAPTSGLRFKSNLRSLLITKELRVIARDPWLLTQLLQQVVFLIPTGFVIWRTHGGGGVPWAWLMMIFVGGALAGALAWLTVSGEDAPELLAASPVPTATLIRAKVEAALLPVLPLIGVPVAFLWRSHPVFAVTLGACIAGAGISCALLQIRNPVARKRSDFRKRHKGSVGGGLLEVAVIAAWVVLCAAVTWTAYTAWQ